MKKKILIYVLIVLGIFMYCKPVSAYTTKQEVVDAVGRISSKEYDLLHDLNTYFDNYKDDLKDIATYDNVYNTDNFDPSSVIDRVISLLRQKSHNSAANDLLALKPSIISNYEYLKNEYKEVRTYLDNNKSFGFLAVDDILYAAKRESVQARSEFKKLYNKYFDLYFDELKDKIKNGKSLDDYEKLIDKGYNLFTSSAKLINEITVIQDYYEAYNLEAFEDIIIDYVGEDYNNFYAKYEELYNYSKGVFKDKLYAKIDDYKKDLDITSAESVVVYNNKVYELIDKITYYDNYFNTKKSTINSYIKITKLKTKLIKEEDKISSDIAKAKQYAIDALVEVEYIKLADDKDSSYIKIDHQEKTIAYYKTDLDKLKAVYGTLVVENAFNGKIGTGTIITDKISETSSIKYTVIVKGDVNPNGKFDVTDVVKICDHMFKKSSISGLALKAADTNDDGRIDITDVVKTCDKIFGKDR